MSTYHDLKGYIKRGARKWIRQHRNDRGTQRRKYIRYK